VQKWVPAAKKHLATHAEPAQAVPRAQAATPAEYVMALRFCALLHFSHALGQKTTALSLVVAASGATTSF